jgi:putative transcriptional regulator
VNGVLGDVVPDWASFASAPAVVYIGGPVSPEAVITLARGRGAGDGWVPVLGDLGTVDIGRDPVELGLEIDELRVFAGYTGWAAGQLENELEQGAWFVVRALPADVFTPEPSALWRNVLRRQRGHLALFAHCPGDPSVN